MLYHNEERIRELAEAFLNGGGSFDELARLVLGDITALSYTYLGDAEEAKDIAQDVLLTLYDTLGRFKGESKISTWIYRIVVNRCLSALRRRKPSVPFDEKLYEHEPAEGGIRQRMVEDERSKHLGRLIRRLPRRQKNVVILKHYENMTISQISQLLGCSVSSVKTHLIRAIQYLRTELTR